MKTALKRLAYCSIPLALSFTSVAQDHQPAKMMVQPQTKAAQDVVTLSGVRASVLQTFTENYENQGEPKIAVFWNREFDDQLSQWYQVFRRSQAGEAAMNEDDKFVPIDANESYERNVSGGSRIIASEYAEIRAETREREGLNEADSFEFSSGMTETFLQASARIVDRQAIMRLVQRDKAIEAGTEIISDYQKIETDALIGYANYFVEVLLTPDSSGDAGFSFMVKMTAVDDGQVVAMFKSNANKPFEQPPETRWVATSSGFEKVTDKRKIGTTHDVGQQLAYEIMEKLNAVW